MPVLCLLSGVLLFLLLLRTRFNELDLEGLGPADVQKVYRDRGSAQESSMAQAEWQDDEEDEEVTESAVWAERLRCGLRAGQIVVSE